MDDDDVLRKRASQERMLISKLSKEDLEDKYLNIYDENIILKKHARKQEDRIKKMATKLVRLVNDKKKSLNNQQANVSTSSLKRFRDVDNEENLSELQERNAELELQNKRLNQNLQVVKTQLQTLQAQKTPISNVYSNVTARIDTGLPRRDPSFTRNIRTISTNNIGSVSNRSLVTPSQNRQVQELEYENMDLKSRLDDYESQIDLLHSELNKQKSNYEESMYKLKNQVSQDQLSGVQENIDQIRLQRELKDKANQYTELHSKFTNLSQQHGQLKSTHDRLLDEIERINQQLKQEQHKNIALKTELKNSSQHSREVLELKERNEDLTRDNEVLKETNEKLLNSAFSLEREKEFREKERTLKIHIAQLEATLKSDVGEKGSILDRLNNERDQYDKLNTEMRDMQVKYYEMKQKYDDMSEKMQFLSKESNIDFSEIEEALIIVRERRTNKNSDEFLSLIDSEKIKAYQRKIVNLEAELAETIGELDKSRHLLITQVKINDDYKKEVHLIQSKMEENKADYDGKMLEYAQLLDIRAARIKKLERQLKDIAYGTKQVKIPHEGILEENNELLQKAKRRDSYSFVGAPAPHLLDHYLTANLERGQNIFEIHIIKVILTEEALRMMNEQDPSTFCTVEFFEHELQTTPIVKGARPDYNFTSQYVIRVDDFFLHYLQKETATIELHQTLGSDYETRAACQLSFRDLIDKQTSRVHGSARLICVNSSHVGLAFGNVEYWARLIVPVDEAFRLYKEKTKALGYLATNLKAADENEKKQQGGKAKAVDNMNELNINVLRCLKITSLGGKTQPSAYCVYKFFDFPDHDTEIIAASNHPEFNDHRSFAVHMDIDLDKYLKNYALEIYVFDDNEPEDAGQFLGVARIPLIGLAHDKDVKGTYELKKVDGTPNGTVDVTLYWQFSYLPPSASTFSATGSKQPTKSSSRSQLSLLPGEKIDPPITLAEKAKKMGIKMQPTSSSRQSSRKPSDEISQPIQNSAYRSLEPQQQQQQYSSIQSPADNNANELRINVFRCSKVTNTGGKAQPSTYCVYKFFDSENHKTVSVPTSNYPEFNDQRLYPVKMGNDLDRYLRASELEIYVFDENDAKKPGQYLGVAKIPLIDLTNDRDIKGTYQLKKADGKQNGTIDVSLRWQHPYRLSQSKPPSRKQSDDRQQQPNERRITSPINDRNLPFSNMSVIDNQKREASKTNELSVEILRCTKITNIDGKQPSAYCVYKFFDNADHKTQTVEASSYPEFHDHKTFPIQMSNHFDNYLKNYALEIYVMDSGDTKEAGQHYLGVAKIALAPLAHDKDIKENFELKKADGTTNGTIDVKLYWKNSYLLTPENGRSSPNAKAGSPHSAPNLSNKRVSIVSNPDESVGNSTIYQDKNNGRPFSPPPPNNPHFNDTMFGDEQPRTYSPNELASLRNVYQSNVAKEPSDEEDANIPTEDDAENEIDIEEDIPAYDEALDENEGTQRSQMNTGKSEDDIVVGERTWDPNNTNKLPKEGNEDHVIIEISSFVLKDGSQVLKRQEIKRLFVSMEFLNYDPMELESTMALPKPSADQQIFYNFRKIFAVDANNNMDKRQQLATMIIDKNKAIIRFAVVSEPDSESEECEEIGYAYIDINDILETNKNFINKEIKLFDENNGKVQIGKMTVTVEILAALLAVKREIAMEETI